MTPWQRRADALTQRMAEDMLLRNLSQKTIDAYTYHVRRFARFLKRSPESASPEDVRSFQLHLIRDVRVGWSSFNQAVCGLRFLYRHTYPREWHVAMVPFGKKPKTLPVVLSGEEVNRLLSCISNIKHRTFLLTCYAAGLRLSETAALRIADIDSQRMQLTVARGKGAKERRVPLSPRLLTELREYWKSIRPPEVLFPGRDLLRPINVNSMQKVCKAAVLRSGLKKNVTPHTLRHSYATGLLEAGVDLLTISQLLGHKSFSTTLVYLHVRRTHLHSVPSPIDWLPVRQLPGLATASGERPERERFRSEREPQFRVIDILRRHAAEFVRAERPAAVPQVQSTLAKLSVCRTAALGSRLYGCRECGEVKRVHHSCGDRHCPQCRGASRANWVDSAAAWILPGIDYYQVVFTIPSELSSFALGNRREMFNLLFRSAWRSLKTVLGIRTALRSRRRDGAAHVESKAGCSHSLARRRSRRRSVAGNTGPVDVVHTAIRSRTLRPLAGRRRRSSRRVSQAVPPRSEATAPPQGTEPERGMVPPAKRGNVCGMVAAARIDRLGDVHPASACSVLAAARHREVSGSLSDRRSDLGLSPDALRWTPSHIHGPHRHGPRRQ